MKGALLVEQDHRSLTYMSGMRLYKIKNTVIFILVDKNKKQIFKNTVPKHIVIKGITFNKSKGVYLHRELDQNNIDDVYSYYKMKNLEYTEPYQQHEDGFELWGDVFMPVFKRIKHSQVLKLINLEIIKMYRN